VEHSLVGFGLEGDARDGSLAERLAQGPLPLKSALRYAAEVAGTLRQLHDGGRFHGDVGPRAIRLTEAGALLLPPNGRAHLADARSDISDFGALLYQMLTGAKPNGALRAETMDSDPDGVRLSATRLAARCLGVLPDPPASARKISTEMRLLGMLARHCGVEEELPPAHDPPAAAPAEPEVSAAPESMRTRHHPSGRIHDLRCPSCGIHLTSSSRPRSAFESLLACLRFPILRCSRCFHRYVIFLGRPIRRPAHA
jgi:hypothetical protein